MCPILKENGFEREQWEIAQKLLNSSPSCLQLHWKQGSGIISVMENSRHTTQIFSELVFLMFFFWRGMGRGGCGYPGGGFRWWKHTQKPTQPVEASSPYPKNHVKPSNLFLFYCAKEVKVCFYCNIWIFL